ncbi:unnamed protein product [Gongylonema pulchrum]|uniref:Fumarylacetoacetase n=1 Tax=Gongylonema pulchrum TaxID=637853 RepID=A0A183DQ13_9BILA|nr:unnamed protein product [Gongylonema pulchrum]
MVSVQNGIATAAQQQKMFENLLVEQATRSSAAVAHDKIGVSEPLIPDSRNVGLLTSPESVKEHISRLISENEAILEQNPGLLKRRPYHRQVGSQSSVELEPGVRDVRLQCTRSQTFCESQTPLAAVRATSGSGGSLTNGQPIVKAPEKCSVCNYCQLKFANEAALDAHEIRCSKCVSEFICRRAELHPQAAAPLQAVHQSSTTSSGTGENVARKASVGTPSVASSPSLHENRHPLKRRLLAAAEHLNEQASTSKALKLVISLFHGVISFSRL